MAAAFALFGSVLLMTAAWRDIVTRSIPDTISLLLLASGGLARVIEGPSALALSAGTAVLLFVVLTIIYSRGLIGGGDVKLMTALAVGLSPLGSYQLIVTTAIAGGLLATVYLLLSCALKPVYRTAHTSLLRRVIAVETWRICRRGPLPYGVAIAVAGAFVLFHPGSF